MIHGLCQTSTSVGAWRSLVARIVRDDEVGGSNPLAPTKLTDLAVKLQDRGSEAFDPRSIASGVSSYSRRWKPSTSSRAKIATTSACRPAGPALAHSDGSERR